jgi:hypothetical protein
MSSSLSGVEFRGASYDEKQKIQEGVARLENLHRQECLCH